jgi:hypothetical protein
MSPSCRDASCHVQDSAGEIPDNAEGHEEHGQRKRRSLRDSGAGEKPDKGCLAGAQAVDRDRQKHDQENDWNESKVHRGSDRNPQGTAEAVGLHDAQYLHAD